MSKDLVEGRLVELMPSGTLQLVDKLAFLASK